MTKITALPEIIDIGVPGLAVVPVAYDNTTYKISLSHLNALMPPGYTGSRAYTGSQGIQGVAGYTGSQGIQGVAGASGFVGSIGYVGSRGFTGSQGAVGFVGSASTAQGPLGYTGSPGPQGPQGFVGSASNALGPQGFTGSQGVQGVPGGSIHGYAEYMPGTYTFTAQSSGVFITASAGGGGAAQSGAGSGATLMQGGHGQYCTRAFIPTTIGQQYSIVVGAAGANATAPLNGSATGSAGGNTTFGNALILNGGGGAYAPYYWNQGPYNGTSYGSSTLFSVLVKDPTNGNEFGIGGYYGPFDINGQVVINPGRGFMIIEW